MAKDVSFKRYQRLERIITVEDYYTGGMLYTNNPQDPGNVKLLVNYDLKDSGKTITPRGGVTIVDDLGFTDLDATYRIHHTGVIYVAEQDDSDATACRYVLIVKTNNDVYDFTNTKLFVDYKGTHLKCSLSLQRVGYPKKELSEVHGFPITKGFTDNLGVYASVDGNTYIPVYNTATQKYSIAHLKVRINTDHTAIVASMNDLTPYDVKASQAINTGYNMLKPDPYTFTNSKNATGQLVLQGIIPKVGDKVKLSADVGETITYHLHYTYPESDTSKKYLVLWKVKNINSSDTAKIIKRIRGKDATAYEPGDDITLDYTVAFKQYTMTVEVYYEDEVNAHTYVSDADDYENLRPIQSMTVSSYYTSNNNTGSNANLTMQNYDLGTCTGMCTWQQRMAVWGVRGATTTLFLSQPNKPEYFPYPNNVEVFQEPIMMCIPYLTNLLVFTTNRLYAMSFVTDQNGLTYYTTKCVQERLLMTEEDASTIQVVKNMVYFKSGAYFYMIVPNSTQGELQIAPVSRPITALLDNFKESVEEIVNNVYNLRETFNLTDDTETYEMTCNGYSNYLDGNTIRNIYRLQFEVTRLGALTSHYYLTFSLNYDTVLRTWTTYLFQIGKHIPIPYQSTITDNMTFLMWNGIILKTAQFHQTEKADTTQIYDVPLFPNYQYLDTGNRSHYKEYKKRFREIQFLVNSNSQRELTFYTTFTLDDDVRRNLYHYNVTHVTDNNDVNYGLIYVERELQDELTVSDSLARIPEEGWTLDFSRFPDISLSKVRYKVSGKGYYGRIAILSKNQTAYELIGITWVYRKMNAR